MKKHKQSVADKAVNYIIMIFMIWITYVTIGVIINN